MIMGAGLVLTATDCPLRSCLGMEDSIFRQNSLSSTKLFLPEIASIVRKGNYEKKTQNRIVILRETRYENFLSE